MIGPLASMLIMIQRNAPTNIIYKLKDDRKKLCIAVHPVSGAPSAAGRRVSG